jgi:hypothetical protein
MLAPRWTTVPPPRYHRIEAVIAALTDRTYHRTGDIQPARMP